MPSSLTLGIDVGTTYTKSLLLYPNGNWEMHHWPTSEGVWENLREWLGLRGEKVDRVGIKGHVPSAIVIRDGAVCGRIITWDEPLPDGCEREVENDHILTPNRSWVPARIAHWELENDSIRDGVAVQLKDMLNWELTGVIARDSRSMRGYSGEGFFKFPDEVIGFVSSSGSKLSGIKLGAEVICGCDDLTAGVLGLGITDGQIFNLANTSEHLGALGIPPIDGLCWLPPLGDLPSICYLATPKGEFDLSNIDDFSSDYANEIIAKMNTPIKQISELLPPGEIKIGGGLAHIQELVESRGAKYGAGQEVSVLGIAKLAKRPRVVIFGAGKVGRGFLAHLLTRCGWHISFVDVSEQLVRQLDDAKYSIINLATNEIDVIGPVSAISSKDLDLVFEAIQSADLLMTSIGGDNLTIWAQSVRPAIAKRLERGSIDIILCENHPRPAELVSSQLGMSDVGVAQAQVLRSCIEPTEDQKLSNGSLTVQVQNHWVLPFDGDALKNPGLLVGVDGFEPRENFAIELTRKLYTYNSINAAVCYAGANMGYLWLSEAANDSEIAELAKRVGEESSSALIAEFGFDNVEQQGWCHRALAKYQDISIKDPIERNARDPIRKLGRHDRILGPLHLCIKHELPHDALLETLRHALNYREDSDNSAIALANLVEKNGFNGTIKAIAPEDYFLLEDLLQ